MSSRDRSFRDLDPRLLGLVSIVTLGGLVLLALGIGLQGWGRATYELRAVLPTAGDLRAGSDVLIAGVEVGRVTGLDPDFERGHVVATLELDAEVEVSAEARAELRDATVFGGSAIVLTGPSAGVTMAQLDVAQRVIPRERTHVPDDLVEAIDAATTTFAEVDGDLVARTLERTSDLLGRTGDEVLPLIDSLDDVATILERSTDDLAELLVVSREVSDLVRASEDDLDALVVAATDLLDGLAARRDQLATLLGPGHATITRLSTLIDEREDDLLGIQRGVHDLVGRLGGLEPQIDHALRMLGPALQQLAEAGDLDNGWVDFVSPSFGPLTTGGDSLLVPGADREGGP